MDSSKSEKKTIEEVKSPRSRRGKLEHVKFDITARKEAEEALRESEKKFRLFYESAPVGYQSLDENGNFLDVNNTWLDILGYSKEEVIGRWFGDFLAPDSADHFKEKFPSFKATGEVHGVELRIRKKDDSYIVVSFEGKISYDEQGNFKQTHCTFEDITERKKAEEKLKRYQFMVESAHDVIFFKDLESRYVIANDKTLEAFGLSREQVIGKNDCEIMTDKAEARKNIEDDQVVFKTGKPREISKHMTSADGIKRCFQAIKVPQFDDGGDIIGLVGIARDITERKKTEEALRRSEDKFKTIFENANDGIVYLDSHGKIIDVNRRMEDIFGYKREEVLGKSFAKIRFYRLKDLPKFIELFKNAIMRVEFMHLAELELRHKNGNAVFVEVSSRLIEKNSKIEGMLAIVRDITERKRAEESLREKNRLNELLLNSLPHPAMLIRKDRTVLAANHIALEVGARVGGICWRDFGHSDYIPEKNKKYINDPKKFPPGGTCCTFCLAEEAFEKQDITNNPEVKAWGKIWDTYWIPLDEEIYLHYAIDITERKDAEKNLFDYQQQLKSLASQLTLTEECERHRLATNLHATIGQSLVVSKLKLDALCASAPSGELAMTLNEVCNSLDETIQEARSLTFDLSFPILYELGFEAAVTVWLTEQIQEKHGIKTEFEDDKERKPLDEDVKVFLFRDVRELLINVVKHAQAHKVKVSIRKVDRQIHIIVEDDGVGFEEVKSRSASAGGFGLFSIRERLGQLGGRLEIESKPGLGTKVTIFAPLKSEDTTGEE